MNLVCDNLEHYFFLSECIMSTDCGKNFVCNANICECPSPNVLQGDKCVGMLTFEKK